MHVVGELVQDDAPVERVAAAGRAGRPVKPHYRVAWQVGGPVASLVGENLRPACVVPLDGQVGRRVAEPLEKGQAVGQGAYDAGRAVHAVAIPCNAKVGNAHGPAVVERRVCNVRVAVVDVLSVFIGHKIHKPAVPARRGRDEHVRTGRIVRVGAGYTCDVVPPAGVGVAARRPASSGIQPGIDRQARAVGRQVVHAHMDAVDGRDADGIKVDGRDDPGGAEHGGH